MDIRKSDYLDWAGYLSYVRHVGQTLSNMSAALYRVRDCDSQIRRDLQVDLRDARDRMDTMEIIIDRQIELAAKKSSAP